MPTTVDVLPEDKSIVRIEVSQRDSHAHTFVLRPRGWFAKTLGLLIACAMLVFAFVFSIVVFCLLAGIALTVLTYLGWCRIRKRTH